VASIPHCAVFADSDSGDFLTRENQMIFVFGAKESGGEKFSPLFSFFPKTLFYFRGMSFKANKH